jgi:DNA repair protein RadD
MTRVLRSDQQEAVDLLRDAIASGKRRVMLQCPTGWGKTVLASEIVASARAKEKRVLFTVPAIALVDQAMESFMAHGVYDIGVIQAQHAMTNWSQPVQIASVQTLQRRGLPKADVVIVDEAHKWFRFYEKWFFDEAWKNIPIIGLSATPWTKGLGRYYDELIVAGTTEELIEQGLLSPFRVFAPSHPDLNGVRTVAGDYHEGDLSTVMSKSPMVADVVSTWRALGEGRPTLCFAVDRAHAKHLQRQFQEAGITCGYQDANTTDSERREIKRQFHSGELNVVCNVGTLTTGVDWDVRCIIFARPTKSKMLFVQIAGRGLRTAEGKDCCVFLDHSDTHLRLGFVTDIKTSTLNDGRSKSAEQEDRISLPKECPQCHYLKAPRTGQCPNCGFKCEAHSKVEFEDGKLEELQRKKPPVAATRFPDKAATLSQLRWWAQDRGFSQGWASHKYREIYGVWPANGMRDVALFEPTIEMRSWIKSTQIRFAKSRQRQDSQEIAA